MCSHAELRMVPEEGLDPPTYRLQGGCSTKLSYTGIWRPQRHTSRRGGGSLPKVILHVRRICQSGDAFQYVVRMQSPVGREMRL